MFTLSHLHGVNLLLSLVARNKVLQLLGRSHTLGLGSTPEKVEGFTVLADEGGQAKRSR